MRKEQQLNLEAWISQASLLIELIVNSKEMEVIEEVIILYLRRKSIKKCLLILKKLH